MSDAKILLADDDEELSQLLSDFLVREGFHVDVAEDGNSALRTLAEGDYDAMILDVMLPQKSGIDVLRELRRASQLPVLMLTALGEDIDRILGLELGADDYVPKPCNPREIAARMRAILRRTRGENDSGRLEDFSVGPVMLRAASRSVVVRGEPVGLTGTGSRVQTSSSPSWTSMGSPSLYVAPPGPVIRSFFVFIVTSTGPRPFPPNHMATTVVDRAEPGRHGGDRPSSS